MKLTSKEIRTVTEAIQRHFFRTDNPPPKRVTVVDGSVRRSTKQVDLFTASVEIETDYIPANPRSHRVDIRFRVHGTTLDPRTIGYVMMP